MTFAPRAAVGLLALVLLAACGSMPAKATGAHTSAASDLSGVPTCVASQLAMTYLAGGVGAGNNFGEVAVLNKTNGPCVWRGDVSATPLTRDHHVIATNPAWRAIVKGILLSAHGHVVRAAAFQPAGDHWGEVILAGDARDDPSSGRTCTAAHEVTPAYWGVATAGATFTVANDDPHQIANPNFFRGVTACRGRFDTLTVAASP